MFGKKQTVGEFMFNYLHQQGVKEAFGLPGDFVLPTFRWLQQSDIEIITLTHEPGVGFAADCYARSKGLSVAIVTYCVGGLNMVNAIACAYAEKSPVIVISGGPSPADRHKDPMVHHKVRTFETQHRIFKEVTCASTVLLDPETAAQEIVRVVEEVKRQSRPGYIEIPFDVVDMEITPPHSLSKARIKDESDPETLQACLEEITERINEAERPVIVAGVELHRFRLTDLAANLSRKHRIPIAATLLGKSVVRETNPLYIGVYSGALSEDACREYVAGSDCVIFLGEFISDVLLGFYSTKLDRQNAIILHTEKMQVGLQSYDDLLLEDVLKGLLDADIKPRGDFINPNPCPALVPLKKQQHNDPITSEAMFKILSTHITDNSTIVCDTGDALVGAIGIRTGTRNRFFSDAYYLSMGFAVPATVGAMVADPKSKTFTIVGDGAFQMTGMELSTMAKYRLAPVVIIINNDGYGTQRHIVDGPFNDIHMWDYTKICDVLKYGQSVRVTTKGAFDDALQQAVKSDELFLIEVVIPRDDCSPSLRRLGEALGKLRNPNRQ